MNWLMDNPIASMPGPQFLLVYAAVIVACCLAGFWRVRLRAEGGDQLPLPPIPTSPDPYELAYLRGGANEVTRLIVFDLLRRGHLKLEGDPSGRKKGRRPRIEQAAGGPPRGELSTVERVARDYFATPRAPEACFRRHGLAGQIQAYCNGYEAFARDEGLLTSPGRPRDALIAWCLGALLIVGLGGYKLAVALMKGRHNVGFLIAMAVVGLIVLAILCDVRRISRRGKAYIARLEDAFRGLKARAADPLRPRTDPELLLLSAVFGLAALTATPYAYAPDLFQVGSRPNRFWAESGCGAAGCGGGGGGGGGCGGGGGGGCGGGCGGCGG